MASPYYGCSAVLRVSRVGMGITEEKPGTPTSVLFPQQWFGLFLPGGVPGFGGGTIPLPGGKHP